jgi:hypothetical protein
MIVLHVFVLGKVSRMYETTEFRNKQKNSRYTIKGALILNQAKIFYLSTYSMFPIKRTVFFSSVTVVKNTVRLIGNIE